MKIVVTTFEDIEPCLDREGRTMWRYTGYALNRGRDCDEKRKKGYRIRYFETLAVTVKYL